MNMQAAWLDGDTDVQVDEVDVSPPGQLARSSGRNNNWANKQRHKMPDELIATTASQLSSAR